MNKVCFFFLLFTATQVFAASELTTVDEPETVDPNLAALAGMLKKAGGLALDRKSSRRVFLRNGVKVAALITTTDKIGDRPPSIWKSIEFYIDANNWVSINLGDPQRFESHFTEEASISATNDSITVTAPKKGYCEVFFKSNGTFMDGDQRDKIAPGFLKEKPVAP